MKIGSKVYIKKDLKSATCTLACHGKVTALYADGTLGVDCELLTRNGRYSRGFFRLTFRREDLELRAA